MESMGDKHCTQYVASYARLCGNLLSIIVSTTGERELNKTKRAKIMQDFEKSQRTAFLISSELISQ